MLECPRIIFLVIVVYFPVIYCPFNVNITPVCTVTEAPFSNRNLLISVDEKTDLKHMVLETDSPYLSPVPFRGKRNESSYIQYVVEKLALVKNMPVHEVAAITTANAEKIFGL